MHPSVLYQASVLSPITTLLILALVAIYVLNPSPPSSSQRTTFSYKSVIEEKSISKVITTLFYHRNFMHLIITVSIMWGCMRYVEMEKGSAFVLSYSLILGVAANLLYLLICEYVGLHGHGSLLADNRICGFSSVALAWTAYQSFNVNSLQTAFYIFGVLPIYITMAPIFLLTIFPFILPPLYGFVNLASIIVGYMLISGLIAIVPNFYWNFCFYVDILILLLWIYFEKDRSEQLIAIDAERRLAQTEESSHGGVAINDEEALLGRNSRGYSRLAQTEESSHGGVAINDEEALLGQNRDPDSVYSVGDVDIIEDRTTSGRRTTLIDLFNPY